MIVPGSPCKAFGHTEGRYGNGGCVRCINQYSVVRDLMWYWGNRVVLGLPSAESRMYKTTEQTRAYTRIASEKYRRSPKGCITDARRLLIYHQRGLQEINRGT